MYTLKEKQEILNKFREEAVKSVETYCSISDFLEILKSENSTAIREYIDKINACIYMCVPVEFNILKCAIYKTVYVGGSFRLKVVSRCSQLDDFNYKFFSGREEEALTNTSDFLRDVYADIIEGVLTTENLKSINEILTTITNMAGVNYTIQLASPLGCNRAVKSITTDSIVFTANSNSAFELDELLVLTEPFKDEETGLEVTEEDVQKALQREADRVSEAQTPVQLLKIQGGYLVSYLTGVSKFIKPLTLCKTVTNRNIEKEHGKAVGLYYYYNKEENVFALLNKDVDSNISVVLKPFNIDTLNWSDFDVLGTVLKNK